MKPDPQPSPSVRTNSLRITFLVVALPLLFAWGGGIAHPLLDWASLPGAWLAGLPATLGFAGLVGVSGIAATVIMTRSGAHRRIHRRAERLLAIAGAAAALAVLASGAAANRPASWLPFLLAAGVLSPRGGETAWSIGPRAGVVVSWGMWLAAMRLRPWSEGLLPEAVEDFAAGAVDAALVPMIPFLPLLPVGIVAALLVRRAAPARRGAVVGAGVALLLEKTFGPGEHWVAMASIGALFGAWPPRLRIGSSLVSTALPLAVGAMLGALMLGLTERWNCAAGAAAAAEREEFIFFHGEDDGESLGVMVSNLEALIVLRRDGSLERLQSGVVTGSAEAEPPGGILVTPPRPEMPLARLVETEAGLRVEWWDGGTMQETMRREVAGPCTPVSGAMEIGTLRVWIACSDEGLVRVVDPKAGVAPQEWVVGGRPTAVELVGDALTVFRSGPVASGRVHRIPGLALLRERIFGPWAGGMADSPQRIAVGRGPVGHLQVFGTPHREDRSTSGTSYAEELAAALSLSTDSVRVGNWPEVPHRAEIGDRERGWYESVWVTSPVDARVTLVDLDVTWHQRSIPIGAPLRSVWVDPDSGRLFGMNRCGVFSLRQRTTFPWDP